MLDARRITAQLHTPHPITVVEATASTNTDLRELALAGAPAGTTLIAATQTGGRGRRGRTFHSPEGGLYLSTLLRPEGETDPGRITCYGAVAAARAIERLCPLSVGIKWVNDLYLEGRKVAGILAEGVLAPEGTLSAVVLGIGINLYGTLPPELESIATTVAAHGPTLSREDLAAAFLNEWERVYAVPDHAAVMEEYRRRSIVLGREVTVVQGEHTYPAVATAITDEGHLRVSTPTGEQTLCSGEVSLRL